MGVKSYSDTGTTKYIFHRKAGRSIIERRPIFSPDGESLVIPVENVVRVYNIHTGDCVHTLETESLITELVGIQFPDNEEYNLYGCSDNGCVTIWTWENRAVLREINLKLPAEIKVVTFDLLDNSTCFVTGKRTISKQNLYLATYSLKTGQLINEFQPRIPFKCTDIVRVAIGWCNGFRFAAIINGTKHFIVFNLAQPHVSGYETNYNGFRILSIAAHCRDNAIATTDALGRITIFRGNLFTPTSLSREILHWHNLPLFSVCFSTQGSYLYSGGMEEVMIKWTLGHLSNVANEKEFIPRLPGMIRYITANNMNVAITLANNSVVIASTQMRVMSTILECGGLSPVARAVGTSLTYHQPLGALLMGGRTGHLQVYSTVSNKVLYNIDITGYNRLTPHRKQLLPLETEITCAAVSGNGSWLVTSEYRNDGIMYPDEKLKFWTLKKGPSPFILNTCVNLSHGGCKVGSLALDHKAEFCVSAGADQKFRIWKREKQPHSRKVAWSCTTACYYSSGISEFLSQDIMNNYKIGETAASGVENFAYLTDQPDQDILIKIFNAHKDNSLVDIKEADSGVRRNDEFDMGGVAISKDTSLIAAWFGRKLTLWDTHMSTLRTVLSHPAIAPKGKEVLFGNLDAAHYLVCTTEKCLAVWSLLSLTVKWLVQINPTSLAADPISNKMAVTTSNNDVYVFSPLSSKPILSRKNLLNPKTGVFQLCTFGACSDDEIRLYMTRNDSEVYCLEPEDSEEGSLEVISRRNLPTSNFSALLAEQQLSGVKAAVPVDTDIQDPSSNTSIIQFLTASPHMVPPVSLMCTSFLQQLSGQQEPEEETADNEEASMDIDSSDDEDTSIPKPTPQIPRVTFWTPNYEGVKEKKLNKILKEPFLDLHTTATIFGM